MAVRSLPVSPSGTHRAAPRQAAKPTELEAAQSPVTRDRWRRSEGSQITPLIDRSQVVPAVMETIRGAKTSLQLQSYLFGGDIAQDIAKALVAKKKEGVAVQVLLDPKLSIVGADDDGKAIQYLKDHGVEVLTYPVNQLNPGVPRLKQGNAINHAKMLIADGKVAIAGGMNLSALGVEAHDFMARIQGPGASQMAQLFNEDWRLSGGKPLTIPTAPAVGNSRIQLAESSPGVRNIAELVTSHFDAAKTSIKVEALFLDRPDYVRSLIAAHRRGVDVQVLLDKSAIQETADSLGIGPIVDKLPIDTLPNLAAIDQLLDAGVPVHLYEPHDGLSYLHGKLAIVDGEHTLLGSANFTSQATTRNREILMDLEDKETARTFERGFDKDWAQHSEKVTKLPGWQERLAPVVGAFNRWFYGIQ